MAARKRPTHVELAEHLFLSTTKVKEYLSLGVIARGATLDRAREAYIRHLRAEKGGVTQERRRLDAAKAELEEMRAAKLRGELVPAEDQDRVVVALMSTVGARLGAVGAQVAPLLAVETDPARCQELVQEAIDEAQHDLVAEAEDAEARLPDAESVEASALG